MGYHGCKGLLIFLPSALLGYYIEATSHLLGDLRMLDADLEQVSHDRVYGWEVV